MRANIFRLAALVSLLSLPVPALAVPVTFQFSGTLFDVPGVLTSAFGVGDTVTGSFTFESTTPATPYGLGEGPANYYYEAITSLSGTAGGYAFGGASPTFIFVMETPGYDAYDARSTNMTGAPIGSYLPVSVVLDVFDPTRTSLSGLALPLTPPGLSPYAIIELTFASASDFPPTAQAYAHLDSLTLLEQQGPVVPEPATVFLVGGGLAAACLRRRRSRRG